YGDQTFDILRTHAEHVRIASRLTPAELEQRRRDLPQVQLVDVRNPGEHGLGALPDAINIPVSQLPARLTEIDPQLPTVVYCAGGYRSSASASALRASGFGDASDLLGGYRAWPQTAPPTRTPNRS